MANTSYRSRSWVLNCIAVARKPLSMGEIVDRTGLSLKTVTTRVRELLERGQVKRYYPYRGSGRVYRYLKADDVLPGRKKTTGR